jgi:serine/threonine protein kinase/Tfp pilus assembly protein PilF
VTLTVGTRFAQYEIVAPLGAGGMGEVYRARDSRLDRDVAIKVLPERFANDPEMRDRFEREARAVAALSHPGIVAIHELALVEGRTLAVTELLQGESLRERIARGALPWREAAELGSWLADALAAAHDKGIIHRDLKPENIFLTAGGHAKILDFGLARTPSGMGLDSSSPTRLVTEPGRVLGTVGYMAPEQVRGLEAGPTADIFALGVVLYEMITGIRPFGGGSAADTMAAILTEMPPDPAKYAPEAPPLVGQVVLHCLQKQPENRFQSARDLGRALRGLLAESSPAHGAAARGRSRAPAKSIAVLPFENLTEDPNTDYLAEGLTEAIINSLSQLPKLRVVPRSTVFRYVGRHEDLKSTGLALNVRSLVTGRIVQRGDTLNIQVELVDVASESQLWGDRYRRQVTDIFSLQEEIAWQISEALRVRLSGEQKKRLKRRPTRSADAYHEYLRGRYHWNKWTPADFRKAVEHFERAIEKDPQYALAYSGLSDAYGAMGYYGYLSPQVAMPRAKAAALRALQLDEGLAEAHCTMALSCMFYDRDWPAAERELMRAIEINPRLATAHSFYGLYLSADGRPDAAIAEAKRGEELDPLSPLMQLGVAWAYHFAHDEERALQQVRRMLEIDPQFAEGNMLLAYIEEQRGRFPKAAAALETAALGLGAPRDLFAPLHEAARSGQESAYWEARLEIMTRLAAHGYVPPYAFAYIHTRMGRTDEAIAWLERTLEERGGHIVFLKTEPAFDPLRADPRFQAILAKAGLLAPTEA